MIFNTRTNGLWLLLFSVLILSGSGYCRDSVDSATARMYSQGARIPYRPFGGTLQTSQITQGSTTTLECRQSKARIPQHDIDLGRTEWVLRKAGSNKALLKVTFSEIWSCLDFNPKTGRYLLVTQNEHGIKITLRGLLYLDERNTRFVESVFDKKQFEAAASLLSPDGTYLALIGAPAGQDDYQLYVLDLEKDELKRLGEAPAAPPLDSETLSDPVAVDMTANWESPERHYAEMDPGIWRFTDYHTLEVSYGEDTRKARSKNRTIRTWDLASDPAVSPESNK